MPEFIPNVRLDQYTTLKVGGVADYVVEVRSEEEVGAVGGVGLDTAQPLLVLGGGSNVLVADEGYRGIVALMKITGTSYQEEGDEIQVTAGAGIVFDELIEETTSRNLWGLENLSSIPGSVGATPVQNVGAYGVEVSQVIKHVTAINKKTFFKKVFTKDECQFFYRQSFFKTEEGSEWIIVSVTFIVKKNSSPLLNYADLASLQEESDLTPAKVRATVVAIRAVKFPNWREVGTAGSFFKNPIIPTEQYTHLEQQYPGLVGYPDTPGMTKVSLGWILDKVCNLRGYTQGNVCLSQAQALVLINNGNATAAEINLFVKNISEKVFLKTKIKIEREVLVI
jgi:UDP-N-acetylmuramate dehydrogenase